MDAIADNLAIIALSIDCGDRMRCRGPTHLRVVAVRPLGTRFRTAGLPGDAGKRFQRAQSSARPTRRVERRTRNESIRRAERDSPIFFIPFLAALPLAPGCDWTEGPGRSLAVDTTNGHRKSMVGAHFRHLGGRGWNAPASQREAVGTVTPNGIRLAKCFRS